ncbi:lytic transglycosylase domain-containing protein [Actinomadura sp. BRA 177]|uniref:aggregation-promoting factor C-terminal-like domain-containing protein n=1 Tax=Actinomadura sp. BRA 177 TaxID=2745202 RepID=UPI0015952B85|nr:lytic transglycosylase domain-containing protein [Actinomadura sp. BRA 177]NVI86214.1 lytic transglycosylase domain-containing protein [Actinomadura sp. BRA 177]
MAAFTPPSPAQSPASAPRETAPQPIVSEASAPHEDDVRVAGTDRAAAGAPAGDTLGFRAMPPEPMRTGVSGEEPHDEIASNRRSPHGKGGSGRRNGMRIVAVAAGAAVVIGGGAVAAFALTGGSGDSGDSAATVSPTRKVADAAPKVDPKVLEQQRKELALERASRATREDSGKGPSIHPKGEPIPTKTPEKKKDDDGGGSGGGAPVGDPVPKGEAQEIAKKLMPSFGFTGDGQFGCLVKLWDRESGWNTHAANPSGAYGIPQALPGSKMSSAGPDWRNNATTQIKWGLGYIKDRYKTPCGGWSHFQSAGWY